MVNVQRLHGNNDKWQEENIEVTVSAGWCIGGGSPVSLPLYRTSILRVTL